MGDKVELKLTHGPVAAFNVEKITLAVGAGTGAAGANGTNGTDGVNGVFSGSESTVTVAVDDKVAILDTSDSGSPKFVTAQGIADLGGGGGGLWSLVEERTMTGNIVELFTLTDEDIIQIDLVGINLSAAGILRLSLSTDGGSTYPATHNDVQLHFRTTVNPPYVNSETNLSYFSAHVDSTATSNIRAKINLSELNSAGWSILDNVVGVTPYIWAYRAHGYFKTNGAVNKIKITTSTGVNINSGKIVITKRVFA